MSRFPIAFLAALVVIAPASGAGLLIPTDQSVPPLGMVSHQVKATVVEQVATTSVTQVFRNHTDRALEATYIFPVPRGASVNQFTMWIDGKEVKGEMLEADQARQIYTDIVRRMQDPGLLEYIGNDVLKVRVFPVPARGDQKLSVRFTAVCACDSGLTEFVYPLKSDSKAAQTLEKFSLDVSIQSQNKVHNVYSPTHSVKVDPKGDHETCIAFEQEKATLDKDFRLFYQLGTKDVGLTALTHRPDKGKDGSFMLLISPRAEMFKAHQTPRDMVFVLDTSGSMAGAKMEQAKKAVKFCLNSLSESDRFAVLNFATSVNSWSDGLTRVTKETVEQAKQWVDDLTPTGGTAIDQALRSALNLRPSWNKRMFTIVFFTDGQPTVGDTNPEHILKNAMQKNNAHTRIFTFGVGDDVNASLLDQLAEKTRSASAYVRPEEDIEVKVSGLYSKISHPVLTDLKLSVGGKVKLLDVYPKQLPDLFHGGQLVVVGRYKGDGAVAMKLTGEVDGSSREFVHDVTFPGKTSEDKAFVENLWARKKVGYLLDEIRSHGKNKELIDEVVMLSKKHGITTPYTSYLIVPDVAPGSPVVRAMPVDSAPSQPRVTRPSIGHRSSAPAAAPSWGAPALSRLPSIQTGATTTDSTSAVRPVYTAEPASLPAPSVVPVAATAAPLPQAGKEGVELALETAALRNDNRAATNSRRAAGRTCLEVGGLWVDSEFRWVDANSGKGTPTVAVKALSTAYFRLLEKHPELKEAFQLGTRVIWITPSGTALVIEPDKGKEALTDSEIEKLFRK